jgi:hypothetical protein
MASAHDRRGKAGRPFTPQEDERLVALRVGGMTLDKIALALGRGKSSVQVRLVLLAKRDEAGGRCAVSNSSSAIPAARS